MSKTKTPQPPCKPWWCGDVAVEHYMPPVADAISRHMPKGDAWTDIYNRAYEAVYLAIKAKPTATIKDNNEQT